MLTPMEKNGKLKIDQEFENIKSRLYQFYQKSENSDTFFLNIKKFISTKTDVDLSLYRENYLHRRLYYRLLRIDIKSYSGYLDFLKQNENEPKNFIESFTIHVTEFFRDITPFRYLENSLLHRIAKSKENRQDKTIRILSAPCSTGEEPYSIAIIVDFLKRKEHLKNPIEIYACDLEEKVINFANLGIYPKETIKNISNESLLRNFNEYGAGFYQIKPHLKSNISFFVQDLLKPLPSISYDLICCRNFLIYISKDNQIVIIQNLIERMVPNAYLMLGKTEGFPLLSAKLFLPDNLREHIYQYNSN